MLNYHRRKMTFILLLILVINIILVQQALAFDHSASKYLDNLAGQEDLHIKTTKNISQIVGEIIKYVVGFLGVIFLILILYAGLLWMTAGGSQEDVNQARLILKWSIIGVIVVLGAYSISYYVIKNTQEATNPVSIPDVPIEGESDDILSPVDVCSEVTCSNYNLDQATCESWRDVNGNSCCSYDVQSKRCL